MLFLAAAARALNLPADPRPAEASLASISGRQPLDLRNALTALESSDPSDAFVARLTADLGSQELLNPYVSFKAIAPRLATSPPNAGCRGGTLRIKARLANTSRRLLSHLTLQVTTLPEGDLLVNADRGPAGVGAILTIPTAGAYAEGVLAPGKSVDVSLTLCLQTGASVPFFADVLGDAD